MAILRNIVLLGGLAVPLLAAAHDGGGLDGYGCHKDRQPGGSYHCHQGALRGQAFPRKEAMLKELHRRERAAELKKKSR